MVPHMTQGYELLGSHAYNLIILVDCFHEGMFQQVEIYVRYVIVVLFVAGCLLCPKIFHICQFG